MLKKFLFCSVLALIWSFMSNSDDDPDLELDVELDNDFDEDNLLLTTI